MKFGKDGEIPPDDIRKDRPSRPSSPQRGGDRGDGAMASLERPMRGPRHDDKRTKINSSISNAI